MSPVERNDDGQLVWDAREDPAVEPHEEPREECVVMDLDGDPLVVRGSGDWTPRERELFASLARAAREMALRERQAREIQPDVETDQ